MRSGVRVACFYMHARRVGIVNLDAEEHQNSLGKKITDMMGRCHLKCKNRALLLCSVSLLRVGDKFRAFY